MGYTIAAPVRSEKQKRLMTLFLEVEFRHFKSDLGRKEFYTSIPLPDGYAYYGRSIRNLTYDGGGCRIGFNLNASNGEREYIFTLTRWIALKVGRLKRFELFEDKANYYVFDGYEAVPVLVRGQWKHVPKKYRFVMCDPLGRNEPLLRPLGRPSAIQLFFGDDPKTRKWIAKEMERLDRAWTKYTAT